MDVEAEFAMEIFVASIEFLSKNSYRIFCNFFRMKPLFDLCSGKPSKIAMLI